MHASRPRVLHIGKFYPPHMGGIETHLQLLCRELARSLEVEAIVSSDGARSDTFFDGDVKVTRVGQWRQVASTPLCPGMLSRFSKSQADLVHIHLPNPAATVALLASSYAGPIVVSYHSDIVRQKVLGAAFRPLLEKLLERAAAIVCSSANYLATSHPLRRFREHCEVIPYGIDSAEVCRTRTPEVLRIRAEHGERIVLGVGRQVYYKGFDVLVQAMATDEARALGAKLLLIGDGPLREARQRQIDDLGLAGTVVLLGPVDDVGPYYQAADVFVLPSIARSEAFGIVQLEAMACGTPVINTGLNSGVPFVSRDGESGVTVPPHDAQALSNAVCRLLGNRELRDRLGRAGRTRVANEFTAALMADRYFDLYERILKVPVPRPGGQEMAASAPCGGAR